MSLWPPSRHWSPARTTLPSPEAEVVGRKPAAAPTGEWSPNGIAVLPKGCYYWCMKTLTMKLPDGLLSWLENEAKRARRPKSALAREILQQHQQRRSQSALDLAADLCGCVQSGLGDLARDKKHLKGFGR